MCLNVYEQLSFFLSNAVCSLLALDPIVWYHFELFWPVSKVTGMIRSKASKGHSWKGDEITAKRQ